MSENYKSSKSKSSSGLRHESTCKTKIKKSRHIAKDKQHRNDSKTPPLPSKTSNSIEDLLKRRESLKEELRKMGKKSESNEKIKEISSNHKTSNHERRHSSQSRKRQSDETHVYYDINKKKYQEPKDFSPEYNDNLYQLESEDEENIIEERRKQRKRLLEKLNKSNEAKLNDVKLEQNYNHSDKNDKNNYDYIESQKQTTKTKEITDMFSEKDNFAFDAAPDQVKQDNDPNNAQLTDNWDDSEGYYNIRIGDIINDNRYTITDMLGKGVFASVVRAKDNQKSNTNVAIKIVRNRELMYRTGLKEIAFLKEICNSDSDKRYHCVKLIGQFMHKGHLCLVLESLYMDLRCILKKYGKHGIQIKALISYSRQLLLALRLLKKLGIIHADVKPDNILINEKKNILKLCDFGSASKVDDNEPTPYLVSRFYRAPEIILGLFYNFGVDTWSAACTIYEMATGRIMFTGSSNNKMLKCFMDIKGRFPSRMLRKGKFKDQHFNYKNNFLLHKKDEITGKEKVVEVSNFAVVRDLNQELRKYCKNLTPTEDKKINQLKDMLDKMIILDPNQRLSNSDCLKHPFILEELQK